MLIEVYTLIQQQKNESIFSYNSTILKVNNNDLPQKLPHYQKNYFQSIVYM